MESPFLTGTLTAATRFRRRCRGPVFRREPAPPPGHGDHFYYFELYALAADLRLPAGLSRAELLALIGDHILEQARIVGTYRN
jgi:hypothetical protein